MIFFYLLLGVTVIIIVRAVREFMGQKKHITDEIMQEFVDLNLHPSSQEYTQFIAHLSGCKHCQERLEEAQSKV